MSTKQPDDEAGAPIESRLAEWLDVQGYPLEMSVARRFGEAGFGSAISQFFHDPESGEEREIDVIAALSESLTDIDVRVTVIVECKTSRKHPWVLFVAGPKASADINTHFVFTMASKLGRRLLNIVKRKPDIGTRLPLFAMPVNFAYGATQGFTTGKDIVYEAVISVVKASIARVKEIDALSEEWPTAELVIPLIVTHARLFEYGLDSSGKAVLNEVRMGLVAFRKPSLRFVSLVFVVRDEALDDFIKAVGVTARYIVQDCKSELEEMGKQWHAAKEKSSQ